MTFIEQLTNELTRLQQRISAIENTLAAYEETVGVTDPGLGLHIPATPAKVGRLSPEGAARRMAGYRAYQERKRQGLAASNGHSSVTLTPSGRMEPGFWERACKEALAALGHINKPIQAWRWIQEKYNLADSDHERFSNGWERAVHKGLITIEKR
jgi:hypothetical protein